MITVPLASGNNNRYILSFTDPFSKHTKLVAISDRTPETVAKAIFADGYAGMDYQMKLSAIENRSSARK
jgi:hypothetical protein